MKKQAIAAFDFDGTITTKDTLIEFIRFTKGTGRLVLGFALFLPLLVAYKLKLYPNWRLKQQVFFFFFKGMRQVDFDRYCEDFCQHSSYIIRHKALEAIRKHIENKDDIVIISASIENWVLPFAKRLGISSVMCTQLEVDADGHLTGRFASKNCYGEEKVQRLLQLYPHRTDYHLTAYGDSAGDKALLAFADQSFYKKFE